MTPLERIGFLLRLPPDLHSQIKRCASENSRSLNAEICHRLRASLNTYRKL